DKVLDSAKDEELKDDASAGICKTPGADSAETSNHPDSPSSANLLAKGNPASETKAGQVAPEPNPEIEDTDKEKKVASRQETVKENSSFHANGCDDGVSSANGNHDVAVKINGDGGGAESS